MGNGDFARRDVLAGLGALGAGIGAGAVGHQALGAVLTDTERFFTNVSTAGELDMDVGYSVTYERAHDRTATCAPGGGERYAAEAPADGVTVESVVPGDRGRVDLCPTLSETSNPGYVWLCGGLTTDTTAPGSPAANGVGADPDRPKQASGRDLSEAIRARLRYVAPGNAGCAEPLWCRNGRSDDRVLISGSLAEVLTRVEAGVPLTPDGIPDIAPGDQDCFTPGEPAVCLRLEWCVPADLAGNAISGDTVAFDLVFRSRQCRHADGTTSPCLDAGGAPGISIVAFCTADSEPFEVDLSWDEAATTADGGVTAVDWEVVSGAPDIDTVVLYYGTRFENFYFPDTSPDAGTAAVGAGDELIAWPPGGETTTDQSPSAPCPDGQRGVAYEWNDSAEGFERR